MALKRGGYVFDAAHTSVLIRAIKTLLIVAHGNSLRALVKYPDGISDEDKQASRS